MSERLSVTLITLNEEKNLPRTLAAIQGWSDDIVLVDSGSTDRTVETAKQYGVRVFTQSWKGYGPQKNFAQSQARHSWVLNVDADEVVTDALKKEIETRVLNATPSANGFSIARKSFYVGRWIRHGGWFPSRVVRLARKEKSKWSDPEVHEVLQVEGPVEELKEPMFHYTFHSIEDQVKTNIRYAKQGSEQLQKKGRKPSVLLLLIKPVWKFMDTYFLKRGFLDGTRGLVISVNAAHSMFMKYAFLFEGTWKNENIND